MDPVITRRSTIAEFKERRTGISSDTARVRDIGASQSAGKRGQSLKETGGNDSIRGDKSQSYHHPVQNEEFEARALQLC